jgi:hypothetical protein
MTMDHVHGPDCDHDHDHHHGGHGHDHHHHDHGPTARDYYFEQLLSILICAAYGTVGLLMYRNGMLSLILVPGFWVPVAVAGAAVIFLAVVRAVAVWIEAGRGTPPAGCGHDHGAGEDCGHDHAEGGGHSHGTGTIYLQVIVLAFPLLLYFMNLPNGRMSAAFLSDQLGKETQIGQLGSVTESGSADTSFEELSLAQYDPDKRATLEGKRVQLSGKVQMYTDKKFTLFTMKMNCCAADQVPLKAVIISEFAIAGVKAMEDYRVSGVIQFAETPGKPGQYQTVIRVKNSDDLQPLN